MSVYEYQYVKFTSSGQTTFTGDGYDTDAVYSLSDGTDLKGNFTVPASSVTYDEKFFTIDSEFDTGLPINTIRGAGVLNLSFAFRKNSIPSSRIYFFKNNLGGSSVSKTLFYWDTDGEFYFKDRNLGTTKLTTWTPVGGGSSVPTSEILSLTDYNKISIISNTPGNGKIYLNNHENDQETWNPLFPSSTNDNWTIDTNEEINIFNVAYWDNSSSDSRITAYHESLPIEVSPITFPDGSTANEFILSTQKPNLGYGDSGRKIFNKGLKTNPIRYQIEKSGLQQIQNTSISFSNVDNFYHQMRELNGADFWIGLGVDIYWANGRVPTLVYDGSDWKEDGETVVSFTPDVTYPYATIQDSIKKEFSGYVQSGTQGTGTTSLALISQEKQDSYLLGTINSARGADSSKAKITPILIGDLTDENAFVPLVLNNDLYNVPSGLCSDIDLTEAPTPFIYDDEGEKFYEVKNKSSFLGNRKITFYDSDIEELVTLSGAQVEIEGSKDEDKTYVTRDGEVVYAFSNNIKLTPLENVLRGYTDYRAYFQNGYSQFREGSRNFDNLTNFNNVEVDVPSNPVDTDLVRARALVDLELRPIGIINDFDSGYTTNQAFSGRTYRRILRNGTYEDSVSPVNTNAQGIGPEPNSASKMECGGRAKGVIDYNFLTQSSYEEMTGADNKTYLEFAPSIGCWDDNSYEGPNSSGWSDFNYFNYSYQALNFEFNTFKFDGNLTSVNFNCVGALKGDFGIESPLYYNQPIIEGRVGFTITDKDGNQNYTDIIQTFTTGDHNYTSLFNNSYSLISSLSTVSDLNSSNLILRLSGCALSEPSNQALNFDPFSQNWSGTIDHSQGSYGRHRIFIEGVRFNAEVSAVVESKYWCFKGKSGDFNLVEGLQALASRYTNSTITARGQNRNNWNISGVVLKEPIYYRDLLAQIANEFRVFITDENGDSEIVPMETGDFDYTIDESNVFKPFNENVTYGETPSTEIYNKIVVRYAFNHMTGNYGKTLEIDSSGFSLNAEPDSLAKAPLSAGIPQANLEKADSFLEKIGITEKIKRVDLNWIRDDFTAIRVAGWWCEHMSRQRARVTVNVSKRQFLNAKIGEFCKLSLPDLPIFYKGILQITKINNKGKSFELDLEEYL